MIDIHSHILPGIDDGSRSVEMSVSMLEETARQGIRWMAATPHFYAGQNSPERFLRHRRTAAEQLLQVWQPSFPNLLLGAEVHYFEGLSHSDVPQLLQLGRTGYFLLEMPTGKWTDRMVQEILSTQALPGIQVILAHIERYYKDQPVSTWQLLQAQGVQMQCNADFFLHWRSKHLAMRLLCQGAVHYLASDCHNMTTRPPRIAQARQAIVRAGHQAALRQLQAQETKFIQAAERAMQ